MTTLNTPHGTLPLPIFLPDATRGVVRAVDSADLERTGVNALVMNTYHLMQHPGSSTIKSLGGLHTMTGWRRPIITDSGGFQVYSLIRQNPKFGSLSDKGATFQPDGSPRKFNLSPEKSIQLQWGYGADVLICLDDCTHVDDSPAEQAKSVTRTVRWAKRCKAEFERLLNQRKGDGSAPLLFAVIQGGGNPDLRRACAEQLLEIGFDGYGYGGWPLDGDGNLLADIIGYTREIIPIEYPMHALGVGHPANVVACYQLGYEIFDSAMPTRDARHGRLYVFTDPDPASVFNPPNEWFRYRYLYDVKHTKTELPLDSTCDCPTCERYSVGYLHHLFKVKDTTAIRLATVHNLRFMTRLAERLTSATP